MVESYNQSRKHLCGFPGPTGFDWYFRVGGVVRLASRIITHYILQAR